MARVEFFNKNGRKFRDTVPLKCYQHSKCLQNNPSADYAFVLKKY